MSITYYSKVKIFYVSSACDRRFTKPHYSALASMVQLDLFASTNDLHARN